MDATATAAFASVAATAITTVGVVVTAVINNRRERESAADEGIESVLRERVTLYKELYEEQLAEDEKLKIKLKERGSR